MTYQVKKLKCPSSRPAVVFARSTGAICWVWNDAGDAPTTPEWSAILLATMVRFILEVWWYSFPPLNSYALHPNKYAHCSCFVVIFTRGQFWPSGIVVACVCLSVCPSVRPSVCVCGKHLLVRAITQRAFKLGSPNLSNGCKRPWLRSLMFLGVIGLDLQGQIELQSQNLPHFELVHAITHHQLKLQFPNLEQKCILALFRSLPILGLIEIDLQFNF